MGKWWKYWLVALFYCNLTSCWQKMVQGRENTGCSMDKVSKLLCFAWLKEIRLNRIIIKVLVTTSFIAACKYPYHDLSKYNWDWCYPIFGKWGTISLATMGLCTWEGVRRGGRVLQIQIMALHDFWRKHFWVHSIHCFMLLVQGVRLDWLVFHMISLW